MASLVKDPDAEYVPEGTPAYREVETGRAFAEVRDWGWLYEPQPEPKPLPPDACYKCGRSKADHRHDLLMGGAYCAYDPSGEVFDGDGDPLTRNDLFGRGPWDEL